MSHIRSVSGGHSAWSKEQSLGGVAPAITPRDDLLADLLAAVSQVVYRKKFEPLPG